MMKNSGIEWIGEIPDDWEIIKVKNIFKIGRGRVIAQTELDNEGQYPVYSSQTKNNGCLGYIKTYDYDLDQLTWTTDGANAGTVFIRHGKHNCTNVCGTLQPKNNKNLLQYLKYALEYTAVYHKRADTNGYKIMNNEMAEISIVLPNYTEQIKIADLLDKKCEQIDRIIEIQQQEIEKLKEYKTSVITQAVTKGFDPNVPMKDSGDLCYKSIPANWKFTKTLNMLSMPITDGPHTTPVLYDNGIVFISAEAVKNGKIDFSLIRGYISEDFYDECCAKYKPELYDIYMIKSGATTGNVAFVSEEDMKHRFNIWSPLAVFRCKKELHYKYLYYQMQSRPYNQQVQLYWSYGTQQNIGMRVLEKLKIVVPPLKEQIEIANYIDDSIIKIDALINSKQQKIEKLQEYKKSLIYEYVTGKRRVI